jgi:adenine-specific DNA-methyltransferase
MNTLNYIGCKNTLYNTLLEVCKDNINDISSKTFMDLFAGTGIVGYNMQKYFKNCSSNDLEYYSYIINYALLICNYSENISKIIDECNKLDKINGLIYLNFSPNDKCERMFFTNDNARKADAIRVFIQKKLDDNIISKNEFNFILASLLVSIDKVANTSCVYGAYLKKFKPSSLKNLIIVPIHTKTDINPDNKVFNELAEKFSEPNSQFYDVVYMDPPYNQRQYSANYSPLNYIAHYNKDIVLNGKTALIDGYNKSNFCKKTEVKKSFEKLINGINCNILIISYNNEGLLSVDEFKQILLKKGFVKLYKIQYSKFKAHQNVEKKYVEEYLWVIDTSKSINFLEIEYELIK